VVLVTFVRRRRDIPFEWMFLMFGLFIVSCGFTHFMEVVVNYTPVYRLAGVVKAFTALASWATVVGLVPVVPRALALRSPEALAREVDERRKAEEALQRMNAELESQVARRTAELTEANRRKDEFLAMLSHELRNPLAPIRNAVEILAAVDLAEPQARWAREVIARQVQHVTRLVDDLLDVSRIMGGKVQLRREATTLQDAVARAVEATAPLAGARGHAMSVALPPEPVRLEADPTRLAQVFANLLTNAAKYTDPGGQVWLTGRVEGGEAVVRVRDTGVGIAADLLPHVFEPFTQGEHSLARSEGGLGVGLTLVKRLVELHGGTVEAHSEGPGKGSEFTVRLPLPDGRERGGAAAPPAAEAAGPARRVLVVDDNRDAADSLALLLQAMGHEVATAYDGAEALAQSGRLRPDAVLLDLGLPEMDGYEVARRLRREPGLRGVLLVALTGYGHEEDRRRTLESGFDAHLVKPADLGVLRDLLARPVDRAV
jgi:signal transduction histidine kinase/ActR/RegA family two-component response regulator